MIRAVLLITGLLFSPSLRAESPVDVRAIAQEASHAYEEAMNARADDPLRAAALFRDAADRYAALLEHGANEGAVRYNRANALFQGGLLGESIVEYHRARRAGGPGALIRANLATARSEVELLIEPSPWSVVSEWIESVALMASADVRRGVVVALAIALCAMLARRIRSGQGGAMVLALSVATVISGLLLAVAEGVVGQGARGAVVREGVVLRKGNGEGFEPVFAQPLTTGVEFAALEWRGEWVRVKLRSGREGWLPESAVAATWRP